MENTGTNCHNCGAPMEASQVYCHHCGQKFRKKLLSFREIFVDAFSNLFNLDSKLWVSLQKLLIPGYLAKAYVEGKRRQYVNPFRLFFFLTVLLIAVINFTTNSSAEQRTNAELFQRNNDKRQKLADLDSITQALREGNPSAETQEVLDSLMAAASTRWALDSFTISRHYLQVLRLEIHSHSDSIPILVLGDSLKISRSDLLDLPSDTLINRYFPDGSLLQKLILKQGQKSLFNNQKLLTYAFNQGLIAFLIVLPLLALWLKLLYIRRERYYIEHLLISLNVHTFTIFVLLLYQCLETWTPDWFTTVIFFVLMVYLFLAMRRFYGQSYFKTLGKMLLSLFVYIFLALLGILGTFIISFLLF
ncbi:MAG: DUF3667 domain-containing protein [Bacteroidota bacterium]